MNAEVPATVPAKASLPGIPAYLSAVYGLGRRSLRPALPALALLYFYRLGIGAYVALSSYSYPQGLDALGAIGPQVAVIVSFLPLVLLIYTPFLPLQDGLLRGRPMSFLGAIRRVLGGSVDFTLSGIVQALVVCVPLALVAVIAGLMLPGGGGDASSPLGWMLLVSLLVGWMLLVSLFMMFATPAVVLDGEGPVESLRTSFHLVSKNLGGLLGRLLSFAFLGTVAYILVTMPASILNAVERISGVPSAPLKIAAVIWRSGADTLFFPFWVAALMVLYRALRRSSAGTRVEAPVELDDEYRTRTAARSPFE